MRIFGSEAFAHVPRQLRDKLDAKTKKMLLVGYKGDSAGYRLYDPGTKRVSEARDVAFNEKKVNSIEPVPDTEVSWPGILSMGDDEKGQKEPEDEPEIVATRNFPQREDMPNKERPQSPPPQQQQEQQHRLRNRDSIKPPPRYQVNIAEWGVPSSYQEAVSGGHAENWREAIREELQAHEKNGTWMLVPDRKDKIPIDSKWVFKIQHSASGDISRFKARLCARGFLQKPGLDYNETFSPVVRYDSLRVLLALVAHEDLEMIQFDVKTAFLFGELKENILMKIPEGVDIGSASKESVCKL